MTVGGTVTTRGTARKVLATLMSLALAVTLVPAVGLVHSEKAEAANFSTRTSPPPLSSGWYYSNTNPYYANNYAPQKKSGSKWILGNCTWYAYGRASEIMGHTPSYSPRTPDRIWNEVRS